MLSEVAMLLEADLNMIYLSRFFAARGENLFRYHISVAWNYELHQALFAIERVSEWR